jgi:predicted extracellular nuclease
VGSNITIDFSESVDVAAGAITVECPAGSVVASSGAADNITSVIIDPASDLPTLTSCVINVDAAGVTDEDTDDPPDTLTGQASFSFTTEGRSASNRSPRSTASRVVDSRQQSGHVTTQGVVVGDYETSTGLQGFYLQDAIGDGDAATSDGIFVFTGSANIVSAGQMVRVTGFARERFNQTSLNGSNSNSSPVTNIVDCGSTGSVLPVEMTLPFTSLDYPERFEGMLVRLPQTLMISEYFNYERFGEMVLARPLDGETRAFTPTAIDEPGAPALARAAANSLRRITLDDGLGLQNPDFLRHPNGSAFALENRFRGGDTVQNIVGVLGFDFSLYRIQPTGPADYIAVNPRPPAPEPVGGNLRVAAMNTPTSS